MGEVRCLESELADGMLSNRAISNNVRGIKWLGVLAEPISARQEPRPPETVSRSPEIVAGQESRSRLSSTPLRDGGQQGVSIFAYFVLCAFASDLRVAEAVEEIHFDQHVMPLLTARCLECHNSVDRKGELDLSRSSTALRADNPVIVSGNLNESLLWKQVSEEQMPPKRPLAAREKEILRAWIEKGARWGKTDPIDRFALSTESRAGGDWWSLLPVERPDVPNVSRTDWVQNAIDAFVLAKLESQGFTPAVRADKRTLIRRVTVDLLGLPPTPAQIEAFMSDTAPDAYARLVDQLLESPHYGERWGRHWLDVARYTESQGFEYDRFRPNAWHYRDYVIKAFNDDKPYNIFLQEQIAGDVLNYASPDQDPTPDGIIATSLLVCGAWDQAGNSQSNVTQKKITREEELEDLVSVVGQTFLGMTINCARCHSHKFDPITQEDYYRFKAVFEGVKHGERIIAARAEETVRKENLSSAEAKLRNVDAVIAEIETAARQQAAETLRTPTTSGGQAIVLGPTPFARWTFESDATDTMGQMDGKLMGGATVRHGRLVLNGEKQFMTAEPIGKSFAEKTLEAWVALSDLDQRGGGVLTLENARGLQFDSIVYGERQPKKWIAGSAQFNRTQDLNAELESTPASKLIHLAITYRADKTICVYRNGEPYGQPYKAPSFAKFKSGDGRILIGLRHTGSEHGYLTGEVESASLYDQALSPESVAASFAAGIDGGLVVTQELMLAAMTPKQKSGYQDAISKQREIRKEISRWSNTKVSYVGIRVHPEPTHRLIRGDVNSNAEVVSPAGLSIVKSPSGDFGLPPDAPEGERRVRLARWIADPKHPLTARVMVNRIWHYHFGRGLVETPNDFGFNGTRPSHPPLLDYLASEFTRGPKPWSIKKMHRLILTSATYQQASAFNAEAAVVDAENVLLWRFTPRRLEGEAIRDGMLAVSGELNPSIGGPSFMPFKITSFNSDFYQPIDPVGAEFNRRTIYRAHVHSGKSPMMDALDCPDPSIKMPARRMTTTPLAALALMNNSFVQRQAEKLSERLERETSHDLARQIEHAYEICFGRPTTNAELELAMRLVREHGLQSLCWSLLNATEFMYVR